MRTLLTVLSVALPLCAADLRLEWDPSANADAYNVYQSTNVAGPWQCVGTTSGTNYILTVEPAAYFFFVTASNFWGESGPSNLASTPAKCDSVKGTRVLRVQ